MDLELLSRLRPFAGPVLTGRSVEVPRLRGEDERTAFPTNHRRHAHSDKPVVPVSKTRLEAAAEQIAKASNAPASAGFKAANFITATTHALTTGCEGCYFSASTISSSSAPATEERTLRLADASLPPDCHHAGLRRCGDALPLPAGALLQFRQGADHARRHRSLVVGRLLGSLSLQTILWRSVSRICSVGKCRGTGPVRCAGLSAAAGFWSASRSRRSGRHSNANPGIHAWRSATIVPANSFLLPPCDLWLGRSARVGSPAGDEQL